MLLPRNADGHSNGWPIPFDMDEMEMIFGHVHKVPRLCPNQMGLTLNLPVNLPLQNHPPLIVDMEMPVVLCSRCLADDGSRHLIGHHHPFVPRGVAVPFFDILEVGGIQSGMQEGFYFGHGKPHDESIFTLKIPPTPGFVNRDKSDLFPLLDNADW